MFDIAFYWQLLILNRTFYNYLIKASIDFYSISLDFNIERQFQIQLHKIRLDEYIMKLWKLQYLQEFTYHNVEFLWEMIVDLFWFFHIFTRFYQKQTQTENPWTTVYSNRTWSKMHLNFTQLIVGRSKEHFVFNLIHASDIYAQL